MDRPDSSDSLIHYGVKGMKWGVRRADAKFEKAAGTASTYVEVNNRAANHYNKHDVDRINNKAKYRNADLTKPGKLQNEYYREHMQAFSNALARAADSLGTNASGTRKYEVVSDEDGNWGVRTTEVKHDDPEIMKITPEYDERGFIISISVEDPSLKHYGVKGMKWGVRRSDAELDRASGRVPSEDAKEVNKIGRKVEQGGTDALSNKEMRSYLERMELERRFHQTVGDPRQQAAIDRGLNQAKRFLKIGKTVEDARKFLETPTGNAVKTGFMTAAAAAAGWATGGAATAAGAGVSMVLRRRPSNHYSNVGN